MEAIRPYIPLIIPLIIIQLILMVVALVDISRHEKLRGPKWLWVLVVIFGELIGPLVYFVIGKQEE